MQITQSSKNEPAQPAYVLRGHAAQIHAVLFMRENERLLTGDANGWIVTWNTTTKRAVAVWRAHTNSVLGIGSWHNDKIITHGRDNKIYVWQIRGEQDEAQFSTILPIDDPESDRKQPWLLYTLDVNAINFCSFAMCNDPRTTCDEPGPGSILLATPGVQDGHVNVTSLPTNTRVSTISNPANMNTGMVMALGLDTHLIPVDESSIFVYVVAGYESGHTCVWQGKLTEPASSSARMDWQLIYNRNSHTQPILSLSISKSQRAVYTSSADALIARHNLPSLYHDSEASKVVQTKHAGQQSLSMRSDNKIFATAGWDGRARVYSAKTMKELAVLKWHREGCYALAFAPILDEQGIAEPFEAAENQGNLGVTARELNLTTVASRRAMLARKTHWLALGSKDGKVSLWDIY